MRGERWFDGISLGHSMRFGEFSAVKAMFIPTEGREWQSRLAKQTFRWICHPSTLRRKRLQHQSINLLLNGAFHGNNSEHTLARQESILSSRSIKQCFFAPFFLRGWVEQPSPGATAENNFFDSLLMQSDLFSPRWVEKTLSLPPPPRPPETWQICTFSIARHK